jgi:hypothetical protein
MNKISAILLASVTMVGCGGTDDGNAGVDPNGYPAVAEGYTRFVAPVVKDIKPGVDGTWCQYISEPFEEDMDVVDFSGWQSATGHHFVLYATTTLAPIGTSRECTDGDMLAVRFLGGIGGEGVSQVRNFIPQGTTFRVPKGFALMANAHYLNATSQTVEGTGYLDLKLAPADPTKKIVTLFVNVGQNIAVPPHQTATLDNSCVIQQDMEIFVMGNHLHEYGTSIYTEVIRKDGSTEMVVNDPTWSKEMTFNPQFVTWKPENPLKLGVGDTVRTHCEWSNTTTEEIGFPTEMCAGFGFFAGDNQLNCVDGVWDAK